MRNMMMNLSAMYWIKQKNMCACKITAKIYTGKNWKDLCDARFDFREIENVVDNIIQSSSARAKISRLPPIMIGTVEPIVQFSARQMETGIFNARARDLSGLLSAKAKITCAMVITDGDGKTDIAAFRPSNGNWYLNRSQAWFTGVSFGAATDKPVPNALFP